MAAAPTPYLGSKISLISKSEIRYEGILYTVDTKESTIALAKVQSFGTEDRPTQHPVAPRDEIYEYIIFKATDIKDLMVCETPQPVPQLVPGLPYDPAIVSVSQQSSFPSISTSLAPSGGKSGFSPAIKPAAMGSGSSSRSNTPHHRGLSPTAEAGVQTHNKAPGAGRGMPRGGAGGFQQQRRGNNQQQNGQPHRGAPGFRGREGYHQQQQQQGPPSYRNALMGGGRGARGAPDAGAMRGGFRGSFDRLPPGHPQGQQGGGYGPRGGRGAMQSHRGRQGNGTNPQPLKFDSDYDFEKANEQFQETLSHLKDEVTVKAKIEDNAPNEQPEEKKERDDSGTETQVGENEDHSEEDKPAFYDKTNSFFDRISCEALERQEGKNNRPNWRKEREQNMETFGQAAIRNYNFRRGGGRGMGRGGFRGAGMRGMGPGRGGRGGYYSSRY